MSTVRTPENVQEAIDEEIRDYEQRIARLKTRRNTHARISKLPQEILVAIFLLVRDPERQEQWSEVPLSRWHHVTHVCRHWRQNALNAPLLWTQPPTHLYEYTRLMLERSKSADLKISFGPRTSRPTINSVLDHIHHIRSLQVLVGSANRAYTHEIMQRLTLSATLFRQVTHLRVLTLANARFDWSMMACLNLTALHLADIQLFTTISAGQFLDTLGRMPLLENLFLDFKGVVSPHSVPAPQSQCIQLPRLKAMKLLSLSLIQTTSFLSRLFLPRLHRLSLKASASNIDDDYSRLAKALSSTLSNGNFGLLESICLTNRGFQLYPYNIPIIYDGLDVSLLTGNSDPRQMISIIPQIIGNITLLSSRKCWGIHELNIDLPLTCDEIVSLFGHLYALESLIIQKSPLVISMAKALNLYASSPNSTANPSIVFPNLKYIIIYEALWEDVGVSAVFHLCNSLLQRYHSNYGIKTLYFRGCSPFPGSAAKQLANIGIDIVETMT